MTAIAPAAVHVSPICSQITATPSTHRHIHNTQIRFTRARQQTVFCFLNEMPFDALTGQPHGVFLTFLAIVDEN